jgi:hypothetical protein
MPFSRVNRLIMAILLVLLSSILTGLALAGPVVENPAQPAEGLKIVAMKELWRAGGEDDEVFFGTLSRAQTDKDGNVYLLDGQLGQVHKYSPEGEHLATIGREGDGPGEMRRPRDMFISDDGVVNILQGMPGRVTRINPDGTPAGQHTYAHDPNNPGQFGILLVGEGYQDEMVLVGKRMTFSGGQGKETYFLARCNHEAIETVSMLEKESTVNYGALVMDELDQDFVLGRMDLGPDGRVYAAPERNEYRINIYGLDGQVEKTITREYKAPARTDRQSKVARSILEAIGAYYPRPPAEIRIEEHEPAIVGLMVTADGRIWTRPSDADRTMPEGAWALMDVFSPDGQFERQVAFLGDHDPNSDALNILPDGKAVVIVGALEAWLNQQGAGEEETEAEEADPLEVICYQLEW